MDVMIIARNNEGSLVAIGPVETDEAEEQIKEQVEGRSWAVEGTAVVIAVVLAALVSAWVVVALSPAIASPETYSLPLRRLVGFVASGIDASLIPVIAYLVGLFAVVLDR